MGSVAFGAHQAVNVCLAVQPGERTILITDLETTVVADALAAQITAASGIPPTTFLMEELGRTATGPAVFSPEVKRVLEAAAVSVYAAQTKPNEFPSFRRPYLDVVEAATTIRHAHMPNINEQIMREGMSLDYEQLHVVTERIAALARQARSMHVTTPAGTDLTITLSEAYRWAVSDGRLRTPFDKKSHWTNLGDGEAYSTSDDVNGIMVVDGILGDAFSAKYGLLDKTPVHIPIKNAFAQSVHCENKTLEAELWEYLHRATYSDRVGEVAIGTAVGLNYLIGNILQDEKFPGCHLAFGDPLGPETGATWKCEETHIDGVMRRCTIALDNVVIMNDGVFVESILNANQ